MLQCDSGFTYQLPAQMYHLSKILIEKGSTVIVGPNSSSWLILYSEGDVTIKGTILYRNFESGTGLTYTALSPTGEALSHRFPEQSVGGTGGNGGIGICVLRAGNQPPYSLGGKGAPGTPAYGGGGGTSGGNLAVNPNSCQQDLVNGVDAIGQNGGPARNDNYRSIAGGNGATKPSFSNGGLVYIYCGGALDGLGGVIDVSGSQGAGGSPGKDTFEPASSTVGQGGGGGGGGSAGGDGGMVVIRATGNTNYYPQVIVAGGPGGSGGPGGRGINSSSYINLPSTYGSPGGTGGIGQEGLIVTTPVTPNGMSLKKVSASMPVH